jgi:hypothetical protein
MPCARSVLLILLLSAGSLSPPALRAQDPGNGSAPEQSQGFYLEQNYPNPVNPETWIPFHLEDSLFQNGDSVVVTIRIFNILRQIVAIPQAVDHPEGRVRILNLRYAEPGRKIAYWDGKDSAGRRVPTAVYYVQLVVNDGRRSSTRKITVLNPRRRSLFPWLDP